MGFLENGGRYPEILEPPVYRKDQNFQTWDEQVREFVHKEFQQFRAEKGLKKGDLITITMDLRGFNVTVNSQGRSKYWVKTSIGGTTKYTRIQHSIQYIVEEKDTAFYLKLLLSDEEWLQVEKVEDAFRKICRVRGWEMGVRPYLCEVEQEDGFKSMALATAAKDEDNREHQMLCLVTNGLILLNAGAKLTPVNLAKKQIRVCGCVFHPEMSVAGLRCLQRL